ncbi:MAG: 2-oxoacid:acceptor oxidoreductase family protein [Candidatus Gygaella obscura]|nr:2-oxoacid:acceptor oxidoreductase family protein [Candidatus Gygaella obscura]
MKEIRIHARAGQGAITTAVILGQAFFQEGKHVYAFPHFGAARMGAPMNAFVRVDDDPVRLRSQIYYPDYLLVIDDTLLRGFNCFAGFKDRGIAVINSNQSSHNTGLTKMQKAYCLPGNEIALKTIGKPLGNTAILGAFVAATDELKLDSLLASIEKRFPEKIRKVNIEAAKQGYEFVKNIRNK